MLTAGPGGVVGHLAGGPATLTSESMAIALDAGDGRVIVQRHSGDGEGWTDADTVPLVLGPDGSLTDLFEPSTGRARSCSTTSRSSTGSRLLLFTLRTGAPAGAHRDAVRRRPDDGARTEIVLGG